MMAALSKTGDYKEKYSAVLWHIRGYIQCGEAVAQHF